MFTQCARPALVIAISSAASCANVDAPRAFPTIDDGSSVPLLVVARLVDGSYLPALPKCTQPGVTCLDPPPFWLKVKVDSVVFGHAPPAQLYAATTSHYGMEGYTVDGSTSYLIRLATDGRSFVIPRYASGELQQDKSGEHYLVLWNTSPIFWLPCSVSDLRETIIHERFNVSLEISQADIGTRYMIDQNKEYYLITETGALPRYALSLSRLRSHLHSMRPNDAVKYCETK